MYKLKRQGRTKMKNVILASASLVAVVAATSAFADYNAAVANPNVNCGHGGTGSGYGGTGYLCGEMGEGSIHEGSDKFGTTELNRTGQSGQPRHPRWNGEYRKYVEPKCEFTGNNDGGMTYTEATGVWTVDSPASIALETVNVGSVTVEPVDSKLYKSDGTEIGAVTVDYTTSTKDGTPGTMSNPNGTDLITVNGFGTNTTEIFTLKLDGTATMSNIDSITNGIQENTSYYVRHEVTCLQ
jgi:hypothetical protein